MLIKKKKVHAIQYQNEFKKKNPYKYLYII